MITVIDHSCCKVIVDASLFSRMKKKKKGKWFMEHTKSILHCHFMFMVNKKINDNLISQSSLRAFCYTQ